MNSEQFQIEPNADKQPAGFGERYLLALEDNAIKHGRVLPSKNDLYRGISSRLHIPLDSNYHFLPNKLFNEALGLGDMVTLQDRVLSATLEKMPFGSEMMKHNHELSERLGGLLSLETLHEMVSDIFYENVSRLRGEEMENHELPESIEFKESMHKFISLMLDELSLQDSDKADHIRSKARYGEWERLSVAGTKGSGHFIATLVNQEEDEQLQTYLSLKSVGSDLTVLKIQNEESNKRLTGELLLNEEFTPLLSDWMDSIAKNLIQERFNALENAYVQTLDAFEMTIRSEVTHMNKAIFQSFVELLHQEFDGGKKEICLGLVGNKDFFIAFFPTDELGDGMIGMRSASGEILPYTLYLSGTTASFLSMQDGIYVSYAVGNLTSDDLLNTEVWPLFRQLRVQGDKHLLNGLDYLTSRNDLRAIYKRKQEATSLSELLAVDRTSSTGLYLFEPVHLNKIPVPQDNFSSS